jgi:putative ABC transport system permease protein
MFWNYLKIGLRNLVRQRVYTIINIAGLSIGLAAVLVIALYIQHELGYNKHIPDADRMYRCVEIQKPSGIPEQHVAVTMGPLAAALKSEFPEIEETVRMLSWGGIPFIYGGIQYEEDFTVFADPSIFEMYGIRLILGDTATAMKEPNSIVLSEKVATKIFGSPEKAMGELVQFDRGKESHMVTAIMEDQPAQAHFQLDILIPFEVMENRFEWLRGWGNNSLDTYVRLSPNTDVKRLEEKFPEFIQKYTPLEEEESWQWGLYLQPVREIHLRSGHIKFQVQNYKQGNISLIYIFGVTGLLIVIMACINFINMAIARSVKRAREVGMRKVLGANRSDLIYQFLGESFILTVISVVIALILVEILAPSFSRILEATFDIDFIGNWIFNIGLILLILLVAMVSGSYPAFYLSRFQPIKVLKGRNVSSGRTSGLLTKGLVVMQFAITMGLIFCILIIFKQYQFMVRKDLGLNYENVLTVYLSDKNSPEHIERIRNSMVMNPDIVSVSFNSMTNGVSGTQATIHVDDSLETRLTARLGWVDYDFFPMMEVPIVEGRNFSREYALDVNEALILNEAAVEALGWENPIGKTFQPIMDTLYKRKVIGVIRDYHYYSLHTKIEPAAYMLPTDRIYVAVVKVMDGKQKEVIDFLESAWTELFPGVSFDYRIAAEQIRDNYNNEADMLKIFTYLTVLSIIISLLGLYGLTALQTERRTREIGIRKSFGGSQSQIIILVMKDFLVLLGIAAVIIIPVSWYLMQQMLENFAYRITIRVDTALVSVAAVLLVGVLTVLYHALRAANTNPVNALRYE